MTETARVVPQPPSIDKPDQLSKNRSIYDASPGEIFARNFLAGFARSLGGVFIYVIFLVVTTVLFMQYVWPQFQPMINLYTNSLNSIQQLNKSGILPSQGGQTGGNGSNPSNQNSGIQDLLKKLQSQ